jgi:hypothetical protein
MTGDGARVAKAFECSIWKGEVGGIVFAVTRGKARYMTYLSAKDAGFDVRIPGIAVRRRKDLDSVAHLFEPKRCYTHEYVRAVATREPTP